MNKKGLIGTLVLAGILVVMGFFWFIEEKGFNEDEEGVKCVKIRTTCCPCNMGGREKCVLASEVRDYEINLSKCPENFICTAVYSCEIESCEYIDEGCVAR